MPKIDVIEQDARQILRLASAPWPSLERLSAMFLYDPRFADVPDQKVNAAVARAYQAELDVREAFAAEVIGS